MHFACPQRLAGFYVLVDMYRADPSGINPFFSVFTSCLETGTSLCEQHFLKALLVAANNRDLARQTPTELLKEYSSRSSGVNLPDLAALRR